MKYLFSGLIAVSIIISSCSSEPKQNNQSVTPQPAVKAEAEFTLADIPSVSEENLQKSVEAQVAFGPRIPDSKATEQFIQWAIQEFSALNCQVKVEKQKVRLANQSVVTAQNVIAAFNPSTNQRILLAAHFDSRMVADQDDERTSEPIDGANDGASGVAVLLELARVLHERNSNLGVDFVLFDVEDQGVSEGNDPQSWCIGSQVFAKNHKAQASNYKFGILFDMVGGKGATFPKEGYSVAYAPNVVNGVWRVAYNLGYTDIFTNKSASGLIDDHLPINQIMGVPMIDIIDYDSYNGFHESWHTHDDSLEIMDYSIMRRVVEVISLYLKAQEA